MDANILSVLIFTCLIDFGFACGENAVYNGCGTACQPTCDRPYVFCIALCTGGSCDCIRGHVRNSQGKCIKLEDCPNKECPENEAWNMCGKYCTPTCEHPEPECPDDCNDPGCYCIEGYVRNNHGKCIKKEGCVESKIKYEEEK